MQDQYQTILNDTTRTARAQNAQYALQQHEAMTAYLDALKKEQSDAIAQKRAIYLKEVAQANKEMADALEEARKTAEKESTEAAVQHQIERRNVEESIANLGLTGSGLEKAREKTPPKIVPVSTAAAEEKRRLTVDKLTTALNQYIFDSKKTLEKKTAEQKQAYEKRVSENLQTLLNKAQSTATSLYKSENAVKKEALKLGPNGEVTLEHLYDEEFIRKVNQRLEEGDDPDFLITALQNTLKHTYVSPRRIVRFIQQLHIPESYQMMLALNVSREMYEEYWDEVKASLNAG